MFLEISYLSFHSKNVTFSGALAKEKSPRLAVLKVLGHLEVRSMGSGPLINCYIISELSYMGGHYPKYLDLCRRIRNCT